MFAPAGRVLRLSLALAFVSGLGFVATTASAQGFIDELSVCADPNSVINNFDDSDNWSAFDAGNCDKLCKSYSNKCKSFVKDDASCLKKAINDNAELQKKAICEPLTDKDERKDCKDSFETSKDAALDDAKVQKEADLAICEDLQDDCVTVCEGIVL